MDKQLATKKDKIVIISALVCTFIFTGAFLFIFSTNRQEYRPIVTTVVTKALNTSYQVNTNRDVLVSYSTQITSTLSLSGGQSGTVNLQTSPNNSTWTTVASSTNNNTGTLTIGLNTSQVQAGSLSAVVPIGYYVRLQTAGTSTFAWVAGTETLL